MSEPGGRGRRRRAQAGGSRSQHMTILCSWSRLGEGDGPLRPSRSGGGEAIDEHSCSSRGRGLARGWREGIRDRQGDLTDICSQLEGGTPAKLRRMVNGVDARRKLPYSWQRGLGITQEN